ncbi:YtxH domain-containing protein [Bacillaceae bacterium CLA-AA-H227]|uniref:YtxH domain-containing protein n=1 Tax=Robertmurraya yapensis (ex Hitch et al 2024) TaxID=3133160 RepID=A0ACC6S6D9_9BACI
MNGKSLLTGFIIGGIAAGIATILTAPTSGKETRKYLSENKDTWIEQLSQLKLDLGEITKSITTLSTEGREGLTSFILDVKTLIEGWQEDIKPHQEQLKSEIDSIQDTLQELERKIELHN